MANRCRRARGGHCRTLAIGGRSRANDCALPQDTALALGTLRDMIANPFKQQIVGGGNVKACECARACAVQCACVHVILIRKLGGVWYVRCRLPCARARAPSLSDTKFKRCALRATSRPCEIDTHYIMFGVRICTHTHTANTSHTTIVHMLERHTKLEQVTENQYTLTHSGGEKRLPTSNQPLFVHTRCVRMCVRCVSSSMRHSAAAAAAYARGIPFFAGCGKVDYWVNWTTPPPPHTLSYP